MLFRSKETYTPDGKKGYTLDCSGVESSWSYCFSKAGEICGKKGYNILDKTGEHQSTLVANQYSVYSVGSADRTMLISCKAGKEEDKNKK